MVREAEKCQVPATLGMTENALAAIGATLVGCGLAWIGLVVKPLAFLYDYAWFVGAGGAGLAYMALMEPERKRLAAAAAVTSSKP